VASHKIAPGKPVRWNNTSDKAIGLTFRSYDGATIRCNLMIGHSAEFVAGSTAFEIDMHDAYDDLVGILEK
jgi:hypothetical protein